MADFKDWRERRRAKRERRKLEVGSTVPLSFDVDKPRRAVPTDQAIIGRPSSDLMAVCHGVGAESEVENGTGQPPFRVYPVTGADLAYDEFAVLDIPAGWEWTDRDQEVHLILCLDRAELVSESLCPFESQGESWAVEPFSVRYTAMLRAAQTATVIDTAELFAQSGGCPLISVHRAGDPSPAASYSTDIEGLESFLRPHVVPGEAAPPTYDGLWLIRYSGGARLTLTFDLQSDGVAVKDGQGRGTWQAVNGEALIVWQDGWRDKIRPKPGTTEYENDAFRPGTTFTDAPANTATAVLLQPASS